MPRMRRARPFAVRGRRPAFAGLAAAFAVACGSDESKSPIELYATQYANAVCSAMEKCCTDNALTFDSNACELGGAGFVQRGVDENVAAGATFDADLADKCIAAAAAATAKCTTVAADPAANAACAIVFSGPKKAGEKCTADIECQSSTKGQGVCIGAGNGMSGTCATKTPDAALGDVCGKTAAGPAPATVADCDANGFQCNILSQTCSPLVDLGGSCGQFNRCRSGLFCDDSGVCAAALDAGAVCSENRPEQCASGVCVRGKCGANAVGTPKACTGADR